MSLSLPNTNFRSEMADTIKRFNILSQQFDNMWNYPYNSIESSNMSKSSQPVVVHDDDKETHIHVEVPGVNKDNIHVSFEGRNLKWNAHRESNIQHEDGSKSMSMYDFSGMYGLPYTPIGVNATLRNNGMLELVVYKPESTMIKVNVE